MATRSDWWRGALSNWAAGLWDVYHRHPWILQAAASGPSAGPGQVAWLDADVFSDASDDPLTEFHSGLGQLLDGISTRIVTKR